MSYLMLVRFRYQEPSGSVLLQSNVQKMLAGQQTPEQAARRSTRASRPTTSRSRSNLGQPECRPPQARSGPRSRPHRGHADAHLTLQNLERSAASQSGWRSWSSRRSSSCRCSWSIPILSAFAYAFYDWQGLHAASSSASRTSATSCSAPPWRRGVERASAQRARLRRPDDRAERRRLPAGLAALKEPFGPPLPPRGRFRAGGVVHDHRRLPLEAVPQSQFRAGQPGAGFGRASARWRQPWLGRARDGASGADPRQCMAFVGFPTLVYLAGMQRIPPEIVEAARLDGTSEWQLMRAIVWPLVAPATTIVFTCCSSARSTGSRCPT